MTKLNIDTNNEEHLWSLFGGIGKIINVHGMPLKIENKTPIEQVAGDDDSILNFILIFDAELTQVDE